MKTKYVDLASSLVTSDDRLLDSREGIECLLIEGVYLINEGQLRRAWLCFRRAASLAQFMGIHHGNTRNLKILDPKIRISCTIMWFRIVYGERYLSLMMGLPSGINEHSFVLDDSMVGNSPTEKLANLYTTLFGRILQRNDTRDPNRQFTITQEIDYELQYAVKTMDAKWWLSPDLRFHCALP